MNADWPDYPFLFVVFAALALVALTIVYPIQHTPFPP